jgi:hypothetical protein
MKKLIPEHELANLLKNIKNSHKNIYDDSIDSYMAESVKIVSDFKNKKRAAK